MVQYHPVTINTTVNHGETIAVLSLSQSSLFYLNALLSCLTEGLAIGLPHLLPAGSLPSSLCRRHLRLSPTELELSTLVGRPSVQRMVQLQASSHRLRHLLRGDSDIVQLLELRNVLENCPAVELSVAFRTGVLLQPEVLQPGQVSEVANLADVWDAIFADVEFLQICTILDVGEC